MIKDGVNVEILDANMDEPAPYIPPKPKKTNGVKKPKLKTDFSKCPKLKDDPKYQKYLKMKKCGLPVGAIQNALIKDGLPDITSFDPEVSVEEQLDALDPPPGSSVIKTKSKPKPRRKKLHWNPIDTKKLDKDSVWNQDDMNVELNLDLAEFDTLFVAQASPTEGKKKSVSKTDKKKKTVQVVDGKRGMNGGIALARIKIPHADIAKSIDNMDMKQLSIEQLQALAEFLPTKDEIMSLKRHVKNNNSEKEALEMVNECERFMYACCELVNPQQKIACMLYKMQFAARVEEIGEDFMLIEKACDDLRMSLRLKKLLGIILKIGNQLNSADGKNGGGVAGFTFASLTKLEEAKAYDKKTSILHYLVMLVRRNDQDLLKFKDDLESIVVAERINLECTKDELKKMEKGLEMVKRMAVKEAEDIKKMPEKERNLKLSVEEIKRQKTVNRTVLAGGLGEESREINNFDAAFPLDDMLLTPIGRFSIDASVNLLEIVKKKEAVTKKIVDTLKYFGEDENLTTSAFFGSMNKFMRQFDRAADQVHKIEQKKAREQRLAAMKKEAESPNKELGGRKRIDSPRIRKKLEAEAVGTGTEAKEETKSYVNSRDGLLKKPKDAARRMTVGAVVYNSEETATKSTTISPRDALNAALLKRQQG